MQDEGRSDDERAGEDRRALADGGGHRGRGVRAPRGDGYADEYNTNSHNGPKIGLVNVGQVDDPMEDVLEHFLLLGDGYRWD